jgi:hypothetical protein
MTTFHSIQNGSFKSRSIRSMLVPLVCTPFASLAMIVALFAWPVIVPPTASAQHITTLQTPNPTPDTQCECGGGATVPAPTNAGTDFMLCFEENIDAIYNDDNLPAYDEIYVASIDDIDTVTITCKTYPSMNKVFILQPNASLSYDVSDDTLHEGLGVVDTMHNLWIVSDEQPDNTVVQVQSTGTIVCYGMDYKQESADAFCAIAKESAATDYEIMSYPNSEGVQGGEEGPTSSQFAVAAFYDNTTVTITPSAPTLGGHAAGVPFTITLHQGQCIQVQTDPTVVGLDLTGSIVSADQPVTAYGSHVRTDVPLGASTNFSRDMLLETMPPTSAWGQAFVLDAIQTDASGGINPNGDLLRVLALDSNTVVTLNGNPWVTLGTAAHPSMIADTLITGPTLVVSTLPNTPLLVAELEHSDYASGDFGDPFLAIVPPVDQTYNSYTFFLPSIPTSPDNFQLQTVIIAADTSCLSSLILDGKPIPAAAFTAVPGSVNGQKFSILEDQQTATGPHTISTSVQAQQGFTILAYGLGDEVSYGYTAGSLLAPKRALRIDYPPVTQGPVHPNYLNFRNTAYQPAYLDSAVFVPDDFKNDGYGIHVEEDVAYDIGRMDIGASAQIHLVSDIGLIAPVSGTVEIYSHLPSYLLAHPATMHFTLYPDFTSGVSQQNQLALGVTATPNPFSTSTTINFTVPQTGDITMTLYDELGRVVQHVASGEYSPGPYSIRIDRKGLASGVYVCEISSVQLNIHTRIPIVAGE